MSNAAKQLASAALQAGKTESKDIGLKASDVGQTATIDAGKKFTFKVRSINNRRILHHSSRRSILGDHYVQRITTASHVLVSDLLQAPELSVLLLC